MGALVQDKIVQNKRRKRINSGKKFFIILKGPPAFEEKKKADQAEKLRKIVEDAQRLAAEVKEKAEAERRPGGSRLRCYDMGLIHPNLFEFLGGLSFFNTRGGGFGPGKILVDKFRHLEFPPNFSGPF